MPFIVIDGGEGAGKTSFISRLKKTCEGREDVVFTREPGGSDFGEQLRNFILSKKGSIEEQFFAFWVARLDHVQTLIAPSVFAGKLVICDRFDSSTYAYQVIAGNRPDLEPLFWQIRNMVGRVLLPDMYIFLNVSPEIGLKRELEKTHFSKNDMLFHKAVSKGLKQFMKQVSSKTINADKSQKEVEIEVMKVIHSIYPAMSTDSIDVA